VQQLVFVRSKTAVMQAVLQKTKLEIIKTTDYDLSHVLGFFSAGNLLRSIAEYLIPNRRGLMIS